MTDATIRNRTLIVPSTICNGPVMFFLPRGPDGAGRLPSAVWRRGTRGARAVVAPAGPGARIAVRTASHDSWRAARLLAGNPQWRTASGLVVTGRAPAGGLPSAAREPPEPSSDAVPAVAGRLRPIVSTGSPQAHHAGAGGEPSRRGAGGREKAPEPRLDVGPASAEIGVGDPEHLDVEPAQLILPPLLLPEDVLG